MRSWPDCAPAGRRSLMSKHVQTSQSEPFDAPYDLPPGPNNAHLHSLGNRRARKAITAMQSAVPANKRSHREYLRVAEQQAALVRDLFRVDGDWFPVSLVNELPHVHVRLVSNLPMPGVLIGDGARWTIHIRASDPLAYQRFYVLHELKHVLDQPFPTLYDERPDIAVRERERAADHFAACVLMPEDRLRAATTHSAGANALADKFGVNDPLIRWRLAVLKLTPKWSIAQREEAA